MIHRRIDVMTTSLTAFYYRKGTHSVTDSAPNFHVNCDRSLKIMIIIMMIRMMMMMIIT